MAARTPGTVARMRTTPAASGRGWATCGWTTPCPRPASGSPARACSGHRRSIRTKCWPRPATTTRCGWTCCPSSRPARSGLGARQRRRVRPEAEVPALLAGHDHSHHAAGDQQLEAGLAAVGRAAGDGHLDEGAGGVDLAAHHVRVRAIAALQVGPDRVAKRLERLREEKHGVAVAA